MARSMWKGAIQFGLVSMPVKLYTATESDYAIRFNMLHEADLARIQMKVWCPKDEEVISRADTVKGYEYAPDQYVIVTDEDLESVPLKTVRSIEIEQFAPRDETRQRALFSKQVYYLEPDKIGRKAFYLLRQVLHEKALTAICKVVIRDREALATLDPFENTMALTTLHWPDEIRSTGEFDLPAADLDFKAAEIKMAELLVASMTEPFDPAVYKDEYREALLAVIEAKVGGAEIAHPEPVPESTNLIDLMKVLEASVKAAGKKRAASSPAPAPVGSTRSKRASTPSARPAARRVVSKKAAAKAEKALAVRRKSA